MRARPTRFPLKSRSTEPHAYSPSKCRLKCRLCIRGSTRRGSKSQGTNMIDIIIVGAGGFGREVYQWASVSFSPDQYRIKGFLSQNCHDLDGYNVRLPILGNDQTYYVKPNDRFLYA